LKGVPCLGGDTQGRGGNQGSGHGKAKTTRQKGRKNEHDEKEKGEGEGRLLRGSPRLGECVLSGGKTVSCVRKIFRGKSSEQINLSERRAATETKNPPNPGQKVHNRGKAVTTWL